MQVKGAIGKDIQVLLEKQEHYLLLLQVGINKRIFYVSNIIIIQVTLYLKRVFFLLKQKQQKRF